MSDRLRRPRSLSGIDPFSNDRIEFSEDDLAYPAKHVFKTKQFLHRHKASLIVTATFWVITLIGLVAVIIALQKEGNPARENVGGLTTLLLLGFGAGLATAVYPMWRFFITPGKLTIDTAGLRWSTWLGKHKKAWDEVVSVWRREFVMLRGGEVESWSSNFTVEFDDGSKLRFDHSLTNYKELAAKIEVLSTDEVLARKLEEFKDGEAVFGPIIVQPDLVRLEFGINAFFQKTAVAWDKLRKWGISNGCLVFVVKKTTHRCELARIPNYRSLMILIESASGKPPTTSGLHD